MIRHQLLPPCLCLCSASLSCISHLPWIHSHSQTPHSEASIWPGDGACYFSMSLSLHHPHSPDREEERPPVTHGKTGNPSGLSSTSCAVHGPRRGTAGGGIPLQVLTLTFLRSLESLFIVSFKVKLIYSQSAHSQGILTS